jgi:hypothetical protein
MWNLVEKLRRYRTAPHAPGAHWKIVGSDDGKWSIFGRRAGGRPAPISVSLLRAGTLGTPPETKSQRGNHDRAAKTAATAKDDLSPPSPPAPEAASQPAHSSHCSSDVEDIPEQDGAGEAVAEVLYVEAVDESMNHATSDVRSSAGSANGASTGGSGSGSNGNTMSATDAQQIRETLAGKVICPFCGQTKSASAEPCPRCTMEDTPATRQATKTRIGPWYVLQNRSPSAPGMKFSTLLWLVNKGHVTARSIVRGPTTHQLWRYAAHVRGLSREFGLCYSCGEVIAKSSAACPHCDRPQEPPVDPDVLVETRETFAPAPATTASAVSAAPAAPTASAPLKPSITRQPIMREIPIEAAAPAVAAATAPSPVQRRNGNGKGAPEPAPFATDDAVEDVRADHLDPPAYESSHSERLRLRGEMSVRQRQEQLRLTGGGRDVSGMALVSALQEPAAAESAPRRVSLINVALFLLLLGAGAAAVVLYLRPEYRAPTASWFNNAWTTVRDRVASFKPTSPGEPSPTAVARDTTKAPPVVAPQLPKEEPKPPTPDPGAVAAKDTSRVNEQPQVIAPAPDPKHDAAAQLARNQQQEHPAQQQRPQTQEQPEPKPTSPPPQDQPAPERVTRRDRQQQRQQQPEQAQAENDTRRDLERDMDEVRKLWDKALAAEWEDDYASAIRYYEQIKKFPAAAWESKRGQLEINLRIVKSKVESSAKSQ